MDMVNIEKLFHIIEKQAKFSVYFMFITVKTAALFLLREEAEKSSFAILTVSDIEPVSVTVRVIQSMEYISQIEHSISLFRIK